MVVFLLWQILVSYVHLIVKREVVQPPMQMLFGLITVFLTREEHCATRPTDCLWRLSEVLTSAIKQQTDTT